MNNLSNALAGVLRNNVVRGNKTARGSACKTSFESLDPEVAKSLILQLPEAMKTVFMTEGKYVEILSKGMESCEHSSSACFQAEDEIIKSLQQEVAREAVSFEEKKFYYEKMEDAAKRKEAKDTEQKHLVMAILKYGGRFLVLGLVITVGLVTGKPAIIWQTGKII